MIPDIKKAELHVHLEGCIWESHKRKWEDQSLTYFSNDDTAIKNLPMSFDEFLTLLRSGYNYLAGEEQYVDVFKSYLDYMQAQNIVYAEIQLNSALLRTFYINIKQLLEQFNAEASLRSNCTVRFIIDLPWQFSPRSFEYFITDADQFKALNVVGLGMGGDESLAKPRKIAEIFNQARKVGYKLLVHAGETTDTNFAKNIVNELKPDRIGHGLSLADWFIHEKDKTFVVDTCLTSNVALGLINTVNVHPLAKWLKHDNIIVTLSTDDPAIFDTMLNEEYELARNHIKGFNHYLEKLDEHCIAAAFDKEAIEKALKH